MALLLLRLFSYSFPDYFHLKVNLSRISAAHCFCGILLQQVRLAGNSRMQLALLRWQVVQISFANSPHFQAAFFGRVAEIMAV